MSIRNAEVERLARELADLRGVSMTEAIRQALEREVERERQTTPANDEARLRRMLEIARSAARLPVLDDRSEDDILGYDRDGIPAE